MPLRDFFVFCTSLHRIELRAIGSLSQVRHIPEGETIYRTGELADALYIINRGMVDIVPDNPRAGLPAACLSRGDIFGDLEVLTHRVRADTARARQAASVQCFQRKDFAELLRRVPAFYGFLCEDLAHRLLLSKDHAATQFQDLELSGSLANFDLVTVYQTIVQSSQTGELSVLDPDGELVAAFYFSSGQPLAGHFRHLSGQEAFWQLFLSENLRGTFSFSSGEKKWADAPAPTIGRRADDMLITAIQFRDELQALKDEIPSNALCETSGPTLTLGTEELAVPRVILEEVWRCAAENPTLVADLFTHCSVCELKIYTAVRELVRRGCLSLSPAEQSQKVA